MACDGTGLSAAKGRQRLLLSVVDFEHRHEFCNLQYVAEALPEAGELDVCARRSRRGIYSDQSAEPAAINVSHAGQVQHDLSTGLQYVLQRLAQLSGFFSKHNAPGAPHDADPVGNAGFYFEAHVVNLDRRVREAYTPAQTKARLTLDVRAQRGK